MKDFLSQCVDRYCELANIKRETLKKADTPFLDETKLDQEWAKLQIENAVETGGDPKEMTLQTIAARVLMKVLYAARLARFDLLRAIGVLATMLTKWDTFCDRKLHRIICYINQTLDLTMVSWMSNNAVTNKLCQNVFGDADFAGDTKSMRSTTGVYSCLTEGNLPSREPKGGKLHASAVKAQLKWAAEAQVDNGHPPTTLCQLTAVSKKQTAVSHSTPEAEYIAADHAVRVEGMPLQDLLEPIFGAPTMHFYEDNETCSLAIRTGKTVSLKHLNRTHRVDIAWLHERLNDEAFVLHDCESSKMRADIFTKPFTDKGKWTHACEQIAHVTFDDRNTLAQRAASSVPRGITRRNRRDPKD